MHVPMRRRPPIRTYDGVSSFSSDNDDDLDAFDADNSHRHGVAAVGGHRRRRRRRNGTSSASAAAAAAAGAGMTSHYTRWSRLVVEGFKAFGRHCARNQIRVLLIDSFVMTSLFYPALALHIQRKSIHNAATATANANVDAAHAQVRQHSHFVGPSPQQQQQQRILTGPLSLFSTPLLDSFFPFPEPVLPIPLPFVPIWRGSGSNSNNNNSSNDTDVEEDEEEWTKYFTLEPQQQQQQQQQYHPGNTNNNRSTHPGAGGCDLLVAPVAWTTMKQVIEWRSRRVGVAGAPDVDNEPGYTNGNPNPESRSERAGGGGGGVVESSSRRFMEELVHGVENWDVVTAGQMTSVRVGDTASREGFTFSGMTDEGNEIYTSFQPIFRATEEEAERRRLRQVQPDRFVGPWNALLETVRQQVAGEEYVYAGWGRGGDVVTYRVEAKNPDHAEKQHPTAEPAIAAAAPHHTSQRSGIPLFIYLLYLAVTVYFLFLLSRASAMHSRFGIAFTGVIQVLCSAVMSFSVMAFLGFGWGDTAARGSAVAGETVVPYYLMPLVILIVGVENMATLIKAVYSTPITYSVPDRIGFGLAKAGPTLFITSVSDILALCFIAWTVKLGPVRDLCLYASVLIFVDWWMLHTFFLTVVSIDCQRLELADLLRQGVEQPRKAQLQIQVNHTNGKQGTEGDRQGGGAEMVLDGSAGGRRDRARGGGACADVKTLKSGWIKGAKSIWKARTARGGSMVLLLSLVTGVYYINESHQKDRLARILGYGLAKSDERIDLTELYHEPAPTQSAVVPNLPNSIQQLWLALNPSQQPSIDVCVLPTRAFIVPSVDVKITPSQLIGSLERMSRPLLPRIKPLFYLLKVVILPQLITAFLLWLVLLYLLKDADLLDAQGDRANVDDTEDEHTPSDDNGPMPSTRLGQIVRQATSNAIPTIDLADVLEIWTDEASSVVVVADSDNKMRVVENDMTMSVAFADYPGSRGCVHLGTRGQRLAVAAKGGMVRIFDVKHIRSTTKTAATFDCSLVTTSTPRMVLLLDDTNPFSVDHSAVTIHDNGMILLHTSAYAQPVLLRDAPQLSPVGNVKLFARDTANGFARFAALAADGMLEEWQSTGGSWAITGHMHLETGSLATDCLLRRFAGDLFWFTASVEGTMQLSTYPDNQIVQTWKLSDDPIIKLDISHSDPEPCSRCSLFQSSLTCDVLYWTPSAVGRTTLSFELPSSEVCTCNRHPGGRASLSRPVDHTPLRTYGTAKRQSHSGSSHKHRSTSPSPLSKQSRLSVDHSTLLGAPGGTHSRTESEEEMLLHSSDGNAHREWTVHRVGHKVWHIHRGTAIFLPAVKILVILDKAKGEWQASLVDLDDVAEIDAELCLPLGMFLRPTKSFDSDRLQSKQKLTKLAFSSIRSAAAGGRTILFGQGNVLIQLQLPAVNVHSTSVNRRVSTVFTVPQSANGTLSSRHQAHTPIPLRLNGASIPQS